MMTARAKKTPRLAWKPYSTERVLGGLRLLSQTELRAHLGDLEACRELRSSPPDMTNLPAWMLGLERFGTVKCIEAGYHAAVYTHRVLEAVDAVPFSFSEACATLLTAIGHWSYFHERPEAWSMLAKYHEILESDAMFPPPANYDVKPALGMMMAIVFLFHIIRPNRGGLISPVLAANSAAECASFCVAAIKGLPLPDDTPVMLEHVRIEMLRDLDREALKEQTRLKGI